MEDLINTWTFMAFISIFNMRGVTPAFQIFDPAYISYVWIGLYCTQSIALHYCYMLSGYTTSKSSDLWSLLSFYCQSKSRFSGYVLQVFSIILFCPRPFFQNFIEFLKAFLVLSMYSFGFITVFVVLRKKFVMLTRHLLNTLRWLCRFLPEIE